MPVVLYTDRDSQNYERYVVPILRARGITPGSLQNHLGRLDLSRTEVWVTTRRVPQAGASIQLPAEGPCPDRAFDCRLYSARGEDRTLSEIRDAGVKSVTITHVLGRSAYFTRATRKKAQDDRPLIPQEAQGLVISGKGVTFLASIFPPLDCFVLESVWANEDVPSSIMLDRTGRPTTAQELQLNFEERGGNSDYAVVCEKCEGTGEIECDKCGGTGDLECKKCGGSGIYKPARTCPKCNGAGVFEVECRRCGGTGDYIGKYGDRFDCRTCDGSGRKELQCGPCKGEGRWEEIPCNLCDGEGRVTCFPCEGDGKVKCRDCGGIGVRRAVFVSTRNAFLLPGDDNKTIEPHQVFLWDCDNNCRLAEMGGAGRVLQYLSADRDAVTAESERLVAFRGKLSSVEVCLQRSIEAQRAEFPAILVRQAAGTAKRSRDGAVYAFTVVDRSAQWLRKRELPFPEGTPLSLKNSCENRHDGNSNHAGTLSLLDPINSSLPEFQGVDFKTGSILIRVDAAISVEQFPAEFSVTAEQIRPGEVTQLEHLRGWTSRRPVNTHVLKAMVQCQFAEPSLHNKGALQLRNKRISSYPTQEKAVELAIGDSPLVLLKGPPGTGKTTVITEIAWQCIAKCERILICSQTHQAVRNVLERLHGEGFHLMARHGRSEKLSELELQYARGNAVTETKNIRDRVAARLKEAEIRQQWFVRALSRFQAGLDAAVKLNDARESINERTKEAHQVRKDELARLNETHRDETQAEGKQYSEARNRIENGISLAREKSRSSLESIARELETDCNAENRRSEQTVRTFDNEIGNSQKRRAAAERALQKEKEKLESLSTVYAKRYGSSLSSESHAAGTEKVRSGLLASLKPALPPFLLRRKGLEASHATHLQRRDDLLGQLSDLDQKISSAQKNRAAELSRHRETIQSFHEKYDAQKNETEEERDNSIASFEDELRNEERRHASSIAEIDKRLQHACEHVESELKQKLESLATERNCAEGKWLPVQKIILDEFRKLVPKLDGDSSPTAWSKAISQVEGKQENHDAIVRFLTEYHSDLLLREDSLFRFVTDCIQVFFSTCVGLASWRNVIQDGAHSFDLVIIDEAAHATAGESLVPLSYAPRAVLVGDEKQLPPIVGYELDCYRTASRNSRKWSCDASWHPGSCWLESSLFELLWGQKSHIPHVMLDTQFRMHPAIADFVGNTFYGEDGGLQTGIEGADRQLTFGEFARPVCLIPTSAYPRRREEPAGNSYRNPLEVDIIKRVVERANEELSEPQSCGVITPYVGQVTAIQRKMSGLIDDNSGRLQISAIDVASVDRFQGSEKDVIIISFVRSPKECRKCSGAGSVAGRKRCPACNGRGHSGSGLSFVRDLKRLNVAFSRARKMLILVGDIDALTSIAYRGGEEGRDVLDSFSRYVKDRGRVLHVWERRAAQ